MNAPDIEGEPASAGDSPAPTPSIFTSVRMGVGRAKHRIQTAVYFAGSLILVSALASAYAGCAAQQPLPIPPPFPTEVPTESPTESPTPTPTESATPTSTVPRRTATPTGAATATPTEVPATPTPMPQPCEPGNPRVLEARAGQGSGFLLSRTLAPGDHYDCYLELRAQGFGDLEISIRPATFTVAGRGRALKETGTKIFEDRPGVVYKRYGAESIPSGTAMSISISNTGSETTSFECWVYLYPK